MFSLMDAYVRFVEKGVRRRERLLCMMFRMMCNRRKWLKLDDEIK